MKKKAFSFYVNGYSHVSSLASVVPSFLSFRLRSSSAHAEEEVTSHNKLSPWSDTHLSESLMLLVRRSAVGFGGVARWGLRCLCSGDAAGRYRDTVLLPRTDFPMKVNGPNLLSERSRSSRWECQIQDLPHSVKTDWFCFVTFLNHPEWLRWQYLLHFYKATTLWFVLWWCLNFVALFYRNVVLTSCTHGRERKS